MHVYDDSDSEFSDSKITSNFSKRNKRGTVLGKRNALSFKTSQSNNTGFGAWERHTKGIGMKLLEQMGYEHGKGLGAIGQGITTPVEAVQRVGKVAVGYYGSEKTPAPRKGNDVIDEKKNECKIII